MVGALHSNTHHFYNALESLNPIKLGIVFAGLSFLCFVLGDRTDVAIGGLLGKLIAYGNNEWRNLPNLLSQGMFS